MLIDLDSWEIGYGDGRLGRLPECPVNRDHASYMSGYVQVARISAAAVEESFACVARFLVRGGLGACASGSRKSAEDTEENVMRRLMEELLLLAKIGIAVAGLMLGWLCYSIASNMLIYLHAVAEDRR